LPCLKSNVKARVDTFNRIHGTTVELVTAQQYTSITGVATGCLGRTLNKSNGPKRFLNQSVGIPHHIPVDGGGYAATVLKQRTHRDLLDQENYIKDTLDWIIKRAHSLQRLVLNNS
jgi:hypothetical protein